MKIARVKNSNNKDKIIDDELISIIIPVYNTNNEVLKRCIKSITIQDFKDVEVIIVDDDSEISYDGVIRYYQQFLKIKYIKLENNFGPGVARRIGMENATGTYICFMDSDDELYDNTSLMKLIDIYHKKPELNMVSGLAYEELRDGTNKLRERNFIWVFGKLFKRQFLIDNNLTFNDTRANEDNGFTTLFRMLTDQYEFIDEPVYIWHYEPNSITRKNGHEYYFYSIEGYVNNMIWVYEECKKRDIHKGEKQINHFVNVWIRLYFYTIEVLFDRDAYDANLLSGWAYNYYNNVYKYLEQNNLVDFDVFYKCWKSMVSQSAETFIERIINISYPEFYNIISSNQRLID